MLLCASGTLSSHPIPTQAGSTVDTMLFANRGNGVNSQSVRRASSLRESESCSTLWPRVMALLYLTSEA